MHMDSRLEKSKAFEISYDRHLQENGSYFMAMGNSCQDIFKHASDYVGFDSHDRSEKNFRNPALSNSYFRGRVSLPFFFKGVSQFQELIGKQDNADITRCFRDQLIECITTNNTLGHQSLDLNNKMNKNN